MHWSHLLLVGWIFVDLLLQSQKHCKNFMKTKLSSITHTLLISKCKILNLDTIIDQQLKNTFIYMIFHLNPIIHDSNFITYTLGCKIYQKWMNWVGSTFSLVLKKWH